MSAMSLITKYNAGWDSTLTPLQIEFGCIRAGGRWKDSRGNPCGIGLFEHYRNAQTLLWPDEDHHTWSDLMLSTIVQERITVVQGSRDSSKTRTMSKYSLTDYFTFPDETLILMSSTDVRGLELRVWGDIKDLFERARELHPWLPGNVLDSKHGIFTGKLDEDADVRDMRRGIICIPALGSSGEWTGTITKFCGIKQKRRRLLGDEIQFIPTDYLSVLSNLDKGEFKGVFVGNPLGGNGKSLDKIAEPENGWSTVGEIVKTTTWRNKFDGVTINLYGPDSPNFNPKRPKKYSYLIDQADIDRVAKRYTKDSIEFCSQILGIRKTGVDAHRVMTVEMCQNAGAFNPVTWSGKATTHVIGIDAGYGGDECRLEDVEFGEDVNGQTVMKFSPTVLIPVNINSLETPEDQIAVFARDYCKVRGIPYSNVFIEAGMRATLAVSFSRILSTEINAVNSGGVATDRPVSNDLFTYDEITKQRRLKKCSEHYSKFVTEMWFCVRAVVDSRQARNFPRNVAEEFAMREWYFVNRDRYELETKLDCKKRMGQSPNEADATAIAVEGARRLGFIIERLRGDADAIENKNDWLSVELEKHRKLVKKRQLTYM